MRKRLKGPGDNGRSSGSYLWNTSVFQESSEESCTVLDYMKSNVNLNRLLLGGIKQSFALGIYGDNTEAEFASFQKKLDATGIDKVTA